MAFLASVSGCSLIICPNHVNRLIFCLFGQGLAFCSGVQFLVSDVSLPFDSKDPLQVSALESNLLYYLFLKTFYY